jgi:hypothetical protein
MEKVANTQLENVYKENLFIMKLLITQPGFLDNVEIIRKKIGIPLDGLKSKKKKNQWLSTNFEKRLPGIKGLYDKNGVLYNAESLIKKYNLRYNFLHHIEHFIFYGKIDAPKYNFDVSIGPDPRGRRDNKWVSIKAYAPLTKAEIRISTKKLLSLQKEFLPKKVTLDIRPRVDIDLAIKIEKEMNTRFRREKIEYSGYLADLEKAGKKSAYYNLEFKKQKKIRTKEVHKQIIIKTSKEIAKKFFETEDKAYYVRKIYQAIKEKRESLFG